MGFLTKQIVVDSILMVFIIMIQVLSEFIEQEDELNFVNSLFHNNPMSRRRLTRYPLLCGEGKQLIESLQSGPIRNQRSIDDELHVLA